MKTMKLRILAAALLVASAPLAAQTTATSTEIEKQTTLLNATAENKGQTQVATKIASSFDKLAGSSDNSLNLVKALRAGTEVKLTTTTAGTGGAPGTTTTTSFTPPTGKMGWGNVFNSLALAQASLANLGITNPTNAQLQAALMGGSVTGPDGTSTTLKGVLQMRADGMGWGQIAQALGTKLGPVVSSIKSTQGKIASLPASGSGGTTSTTTTSATGGKSSGGVTTATGTSGVSSGKASHGITTAGGASGGTVTAAGGSGHGNSANAPGRGVVNAAGGGAGSVTAATGGGSSHGQGAGVVNAGGGSASGVSNAGGQGKGNAGGNGNGKGKGGG